MATIKQERAVKDTLENIGRKRPKSKKQIIKDAGYSDSVAKNPDIVLESKGFQDLLEQYFPDDKLMKVGQEGMEANKVISAHITYKDADEKTNDFIEVPDHPTRHKFWDSILELKSKKPIKGTLPNMTLVVAFDPIFNATARQTEGDSQ